VSVTEIVVPPRSSGPPLHTHDLDEAFYTLEGELSYAPVRYVLVCRPAGFERHWARSQSEAAGVDPPQWAR
jgi:hypothetical protein